MPALKHMADTSSDNCRLSHLPCSAVSIAAFLLFTMLLISPLHAQPGWVKDCSKFQSSTAFPREISAIELANHAEVTIDESGTAAWHKRYAIKVLTGAGIDQTIFQELTNEHVSITNLKGWLISGTTVTQLKKSQIVEAVASNTAGYYDENRMLSAKFDGVATGDVVAYEYDVEERSPSKANLLQFIFQSDLPVASTSLTVTIPQNSDLFWTGQFIEGINHTVAGGAHIWSAENLPARLDQPFMPSWSYVLRKVAFTVLPAETVAKGASAAWLLAAKEAWELQDRAAVPDTAIARFAQELTQGMTDSVSRVKAISDFVRDKIRYVAVEIGAGRFEPRSASSVLANRYGDCKDKVALTRALLKSINVPSWPVLVSLNRPVYPELPNPYQFNHCILAVPRSYVLPATVEGSHVTDSLVFLDPTNEALEIGSLSGTLGGTLGLVAAERDSVLTYLPIREPEDAVSTFAADLELAASGQCQGKMQLISRGMAASEAKLNLQQVRPADYVEVIKGWLAGTFGNVQVSDYGWKSDGDSVVQSFLVSGKAPVVSAGNKQLLKLDVFAEDRNESIDAKNRLFPFYFGSPRVIETAVNWTIPHGLKVADTAISVKDSCEIARFAARTEFTENRVRFAQQERYEGGTVPAESAVAMRGWLMRRNSVLGTRLTLTRTEEEQ